MGSGGGFEGEDALGVFGRDGRSGVLREWWRR